MAYKPSALKIAGKIIRWFLYFIIAVIVVFFVWRIWFSTDIPDKIEQLVVNDALTDAYHAADGELYAFDQEQYSITRTDENYGYFSIEQFVIIPEARQVQLIFRYNNNTIKQIAKKYELGNITDRATHLFEVSLIKTEDLTPDDKTDDLDESALKKTRYFATASISDQTMLYNYYRIVFEDVDIDENTIGLFADIYYVGAQDYTQPAEGTLCLYDYKMKKDDYEFSSADLRRIKNGKAD